MKVPVSRKLKALIESLKKPGETDDDVIRRLMNSRKEREN